MAAQASPGEIPHGTQAGALESARLVLASRSPRRRDLLRQIGIEPDAIDPPNVEEARRRGESPPGYARRLAEDKVVAVRARHGAAFVLAADTVVAVGRRILPKPADAAAARRCLELLSGRRHRVLGGVAVAAPDGRIGRRLVTTAVKFKRLSRAEIEAYLDSGEWRDKAGGYAIQGRAAAFIPSINGSYSNVVGLPLTEALALLRGLGYGVAPSGAP